ncbi:MAG: DUF4401 domain-containing protein [Desulfobacteraceae bacterium]|jgi:hypothetical protein
MMSTWAEHVWKTLEKQGIVQGIRPENGSPDSPWYVKALLGFSGWLAAVFIIGFIGAGFQSIFKDRIALSVVGIIMIAVAYVLLHIPKNEFMEHMALAASLAGQVLLVIAIFKITKHNKPAAWMFLAFIQVALAVLMPNFVHRVFSSFIAALAFTMTFNEMDIPYVVSGIIMFITALCWLNEFKIPKHMKKIRAVGYGFTLALIVLKGASLFASRGIGLDFTEKQGMLWGHPWMGEIITGLVMIYVVWILLQRYGLTFHDRTAIACLIAAILVCAVSMKVQGITVGIVILLLGFSGSNRVLMGLGIISLLFYISSYYYMLDTTLLKKSMILFIVGIVLLGVRWVMLRFVLLQKEVHHVE